MPSNFAFRKRINIDQRDFLNLFMGTLSFLEGNLFIVN